MPPDQLDDARLRSLILSARDHVVHGWVLSSASIVVCAAYNVLLRVVCGRDLSPAPGPEVASAPPWTRCSAWLVLRAPNRR